MGKLFEDFCSWAMKFIKARSTFKTALIALALALATCWYILDLTGKSCINVPGNSVDFELPPFQHCDITFLNPVMIKSYIIADALKFTDLGKSIPTALPSEAVSRSVNRELSFLTIENSDHTQPTTGATQLYRVHIFMGPSLNSEIVAVSIDDKAIDLKLFFKHYLKSQGEFIRFRYIRKTLADFLYSMNDVVSNWILTFMFFGIVWEIGKLGIMELRACVFYSDSRFERYLITSLNIKNMAEEKQRAEALDKYHADYWRLDNWFRFLQALGPALGFILTVSSLVQALHPALFKANNLDGFLNGIHVAMISTFLGLLLRIIALEAARVNDKLFIRAEMQLGESEHDSQVDRP